MENFSLIAKSIFSNSASGSTGTDGTNTANNYNVTIFLFNGTYPNGTFPLVFFGGLTGLLGLTSLIGLFPPIIGVGKRSLNEDFVSDLGTFYNDLETCKSIPDTEEKLACFTCKSNRHEENKSLLALILR